VRSSAPKPYVSFPGSKSRCRLPPRSQGGSRWRLHIYGSCESR
jgi:hypothetical protein